MFKGGTALRKFRAGNAGRFSTDLDFAAPNDEVALAALHALGGVDIDGFAFAIDNLGWRSLPARPMPAVKAVTASSNTSGASLSDSATPTINDAEYGGPASANHGRRQPGPGNYTLANSGEP